jgi:hydroxyacylglutathione hydrolase
VDPVEPQKIFPVAKQLGVTLQAVLTTHHHEDHAGGNADTVREVKVPVYGGDDRVQALSHKVSAKDEVTVGRLRVRVLETPCHTSGSVSYYVAGADGRPGAVFTGDTLFLGGCGRFFEGTGPQMQRALNVVLGALPDDTQVYCGHEYTVANLKFAHHVEPENADISQRLAWAVRQREQSLDTVPGTIGEEKRTNPFMRTAVAAVVAKTGKHDPDDVMLALREMKNNFKA